MNGGNITGFHLMTNAEWAAIALWVALTGTPRPKGNNANGTDAYDPTVVGTPVPGFGASIWYSGSAGPPTSHNRLANGVFDLNGNIREWVDGVYTNTGHIFVAGNLNTAPTDAGNGFGVSQANYYDTGWYYAWDTAGNVYLSTTGAGTGNGPANARFVQITGGGSDTLKRLALAPIGGTFTDRAYVDTTGQRAVTRGGQYNSWYDAGLNSISITEPASAYALVIGFRCAYIGNI